MLPSHSACLSFANNFTIVFCCLSASTYGFSHHVPISRIMTHKTCCILQYTKTDVAQRLYVLFYCTHGRSKVHYFLLGKHLLYEKIMYDNCGELCSSHCLHYKRFYIYCDFPTFWQNKINICIYNWELIDH